MVSYLRIDFILGEVKTSRSPKIFLNRPLLGGVLGLSLLSAELSLDAIIRNSLSQQLPGQQ